MKAKIEDLPFLNKGVEIESETEEEKALLLNIFNTKGGPVMLSRKEDGMVQLVIAPTVEENEKEES